MSWPLGLSVETTPSVAVIIPCHNAAPWISCAIDSALAQTWPRREVIVIDDGSVDDSLAAIQSYGHRVTWRTGPNRGGNHARNAGLALTEADYVVFLDADDELSGDLLRGAVEVAEAQDADLVFSEMEIRFRDGRRKRRGPFGPPAETSRDLFRGWLQGLQLNPSATLWRTAFLRRIGAWDEAIRINQDGELVLRAIMEDARIAANPDGYGIYHIGREGSLSGSFDREKLASYLDMLERLCVRAKACGFGDDLEGVKFVLYRVARDSFRTGNLDIGRRALVNLQRMGYRGHHGSWRHRLLASLLGLEWKTRLWGQ